MHVERVGKELIVQAPAKLNLFLEVLGRRDDGFHELETLMWPVSLYDTLSFTPAESADERGAIEFSCDWQPLERSSRHAGTAGGVFGAIPPERPALDNNLVVRALHLLKQVSGTQAGARVKLTKRIPVAAGLGGGSSDAAAALLAGNLGWQLGLATDVIHSCAAQLGSDVPFFLAQSPAICRGRGERVEPVQLNGTGWFVIVRPASGLSTADVFRACRPSPFPRQAKQLLEVLSERGWEHAGRELFNALEPAAESLNDEIVQLRREFTKLDVLGHQMSGSGTSYFAVCRSARQARQIVARLRSRKLGNAFVVRGCR